MSKKDTGGPAFPQPNSPAEYGRGMTLRDYFAAHALQGICANQDNRTYKGPMDFAVAAYVLADAMLKARNT